MAHTGYVGYKTRLERERGHPWGEPKLEAAATTIIGAIRKMNPDWDRKVSVTQQEKGYSDYQCLAAWVGRILDNGEHMLHPPHPFFERGFVAQGMEGVCPTCTREFKAGWAGQEYCSDECFSRAHTPPAEPVPEEVSHASQDSA